MTPLSAVLAFFPALLMAAAGSTAVWLLFAPSLAKLAALASILYGLPPLCFRLLRLFYPLREGVSYLDERRFSSWWGGHQIQAVYIAFPQLESVLQLVPGVFSAWLRLWGATVGSGIYWTPRVELADRDLIDIGDGVIFGHKVQTFSHTLKPKNGRLLLYVRRISIGAGAFLGAGSRLGPGVRVEPGAVVPVITDLFPNRRQGAGEREEDAVA
jgi:hypothetical protein